MICKVLVRHSALDRSRLITNLSSQFTTTQLDAGDWKAKSEKYRDLKGIESKLIWGSEGDSLYGLLQETPTSTLIWIEYSASKDWAFTTFRGVLENFATAIMKSQKRLGR